jgi:hypothetical protein
MALGVIGEYLGRNYAESKHRPLYFIQDRHLRGRSQQSNTTA